MVFSVSVIAVQASTAMRIAQYSNHCVLWLTFFLFFRIFASHNHFVIRVDVLWTEKYSVMLLTRPWIHKM